MFTYIYLQETQNFNSIWNALCQHHIKRKKHSEFKRFILSLTMRRNQKGRGANCLSCWKSCPMSWYHQISPEQAFLSFAYTFPHSRFLTVLVTLFLKDKSRPFEFWSQAWRKKTFFWEFQSYLEIIWLFLIIIFLFRY